MFNATFSGFILYPYFYTHLIEIKYTLAPSLLSRVYKPRNKSENKIGQKFQKKFQ